MKFKIISLFLIVFPMLNAMDELTINYKIRKISNETNNNWYRLVELDSGKEIIKIGPGEPYRPFGEEALTYSFTLPRKITLQKSDQYFGRWVLKLFNTSKKYGPGSEYDIKINTQLNELRNKHELNIVAALIGAIEGDEWRPLRNFSLKLLSQDKKKGLTELSIPQDIASIDVDIELILNGDNPADFAKQFKAIITKQIKKETSIE